MNEELQMLTKKIVLYLCRKEGYDQLLLTKGDNNDADDLGLYNGPRWMKRKNIVGKVRG